MTCRAGDSNSIEARNRQAARDSEALLWQALCDIDDSSASSLLAEYVEPDCVIMNPLLHPERSFEALSATSQPYTLADALEKLGRSRNKWTSYRVHQEDPEVAIAQVEMMSVQIMYRVTLVRERHHHHHHHHHHHGHHHPHRKEMNDEEGEKGGEKGQNGEGEGRGEDVKRAEKGELTELQTVDAFCSSTWRQGAGGQWKLCAQQLVPV